MSINIIIKDLKTLESLQCTRRAKLAVQTILNQQAEIEKLKKASEWISVDDRLPSKNGTYQVIGGYSKTGRTDNWPHVKSFCLDGEYWNSDRITHWQPLPKPPEVKP